MSRLSPKTAYIADAGIDWNGEKTYFTLRGFYNRIDDYIQSAPFDDTLTTLEAGIDPNTAILSPLTPAGAAAFFAQFDGAGGVAPDSPVEIVSLVNGDATPLQFANVDAVLFGMDLAFGAVVSDDFMGTGGQLLLDSIVTYVRGKRRDIDDDLYRITPARSVLTLAYEKSTWRVAAEGGSRGRSIERISNERRAADRWLSTAEPLRGMAPIRWFTDRCGDRECDERVLSTASRRIQSCCRQRCGALPAQSICRT